MANYFANSEEKYLKAHVLYFKSADGILYHEKNNTTYTNAVSVAELKNLFEKGILVVDTGSGLVRPTAYSEHVTGTTVDYAIVTHTTVGTSSAAVATSYYSAGYTAG